MDQATLLPFSTADLSKMWAAFNATPLKMDVLFEMHRRNADAVTNANNILLGGLNKMAERQGQAFAVTLDDCGKATVRVFTDGSWEKRTSDQADVARDVYVSSVACLRDLSEIAVETNINTIEVLSTRIGEALDEFREFLSASKAPATMAIDTKPVIEDPATVVEDASVEEELSPEELDAAESPAPEPTSSQSTRTRKPARRPSSRR